jgi:RNA polymerase sigma-70 factor (TIGR02943 family)
MTDSSRRWKVPYIPRKFSVSQCAGNVSLRKLHGIPNRASAFRLAAPASIMNASEDATREPAAAPPANPERWVDEHGDCLFRFALGRVRNEVLAEDLVQETLLAAVRAQDRFAGRSGERSWLVGILKNKICDHFRKLGRETNFTDLEFFKDEHADRFDGEDYWIHERGPADWKPEGEEALKRAEFWHALQSCLKKLPGPTAQAFLLREMDDVPGREVCEVLKISESNLWVMLHRARMALRQCLETNFFTEEGRPEL